MHGHIPLPSKDPMIGIAIMDAEMLKVVLPDTARHFEAQFIMPNLVPPVGFTKDVADYKTRIIAASCHLIWNLRL